MLISNNDAARRLNSSQNLINRLNGSASNGNGNGKSNSARSAMSLFGIGRRSESVVTVEVVEDRLESKPEGIEPTEILDPLPNVDHLLDNVDSKLQLELAHNEALGAMVDSIKQLRVLLPEVSKPERLADISNKMSGIIDRIRGERSKNNHGKTVNIHLYNPTQRQLSEYEAVEV